LNHKHNNENKQTAVENSNIGSKYFELDVSSIQKTQSYVGSERLKKGDTFCNQNSKSQHFSENDPRMSLLLQERKKEEKNYENLKKTISRFDCPIKLDSSKAAFSDTAFHALPREGLSPSTVEREKTVVQHEQETMNMPPNTFGIKPTDQQYDPSSVPKNKSGYISLPDNTDYKMIHQEHTLKTDRFRGDLMTSDRSKDFWEYRKDIVNREKKKTKPYGTLRDKTIAEIIDRWRKYRLEEEGLEKDIWSAHNVTTDRQSI